MPPPNVLEQFPQKGTFHQADAEGELCHFVERNDNLDLSQKGWEPFHQWLKVRSWVFGLSEESMKVAPSFKHVLGWQKAH